MAEAGNQWTFMPQVDSAWLFLIAPDDLLSLCPSLRRKVYLSQIETSSLTLRGRHRSRCTYERSYQPLRRVPTRKRTEQPRGWNGPSQGQVSCVNPVQLGCLDESLVPRTHVLVLPGNDKTQSQPLNLKPGEEKELDIRLEPDPNAPPERCGMPVGTVVKECCPSG